MRASAGAAACGAAASARKRKEKQMTTTRKRGGGRCGQGCAAVNLLSPNDKDNRCKMQMIALQGHAPALMTQSSEAWPAGCLA